MGAPPELQPPTAGNILGGGFPWPRQQAVETKAGPSEPAGTCSLRTAGCRRGRQRGTRGQESLQLSHEETKGPARLPEDYLETQCVFLGKLFQKKNSDKSKRCVCMDFQYSFVYKSKESKINVRQRRIGQMHRDSSYHHQKQPWKRQPLPPIRFTSGVLLGGHVRGPRLPASCPLHTWCQTPAQKTRRGVQEQAPTTPWGKPWRAEFGRTGQTTEPKPPTPDGESRVPSTRRPLPANTALSLRLSQNSGSPCARPQGLGASTSPLRTAPNELQRF